ncbi:hypothetical protein MA16_Dca027479 [Dendrobium catenatum]|uniref:Uncharacterized protein n=1 Tax=Dendrobium catenatum TaxID=906689 RepID=A0A2I0VBG7_9ASPA|nr:hypothetical protein MA16_Dca027479 [Dendrobium catenatum]
MVNKNSEAVTRESIWRPMEVVKNSLVEVIDLQIGKNIEDLETEKTQIQNTLTNSAMENNDTNCMTIQPSNIVSVNKFNILDGLVEEGVIVFSGVVETNMTERLNGLSKET